MTDVILIIIILALVAMASWYIIREKKKGRGCIGCPSSSSCCSSCHSGCSCKK